VSQESFLHPGQVFHGLRCVRPLCFASFRSGIIKTLHQPNVGKSQQCPSTALGFAHCLRSATLGFPSTRIARHWDFRIVSRKMLGSRWDEVHCFACIEELPPRSCREGNVALLMRSRVRFRAMADFSRGTPDGSSEISEFLNEGEC
jgi:hypothetical protein